MPEEKSVILRYPFDNVWDAAHLVIQRAGWNTAKASRARGHFEVKIPVKIGMPPLPMTETFSIDMTRIDDNSTKVRAWGMPNYPVFDWGSSWQYVDSFLLELEKLLVPKT